MDLIDVKKLNDKFIIDLQNWSSKWFVDIDEKFSIDMYRYIKNYKLVQQMDIDLELSQYINQHIKSESISTNLLKIMTQLENISLYDDLETCLSELFNIIPIVEGLKYYLNTNIMFKLTRKVINNNYKFDPQDIVELYKQDQDEFMKRNQKFFDMLREQR